MSKAFKNLWVGVVSGGLTALIVSFAVLGFFADGFGSRDLPAANQRYDVQDYDPDEYVTQEDLVISAVGKSSPAVVSVIITKDVPVLEEYYEDSSPFGEFFGIDPFGFNGPRFRENGETERKEVGGGSGFIVSEDGFIVTNRHVVYDDGADYSVFTQDGEEYVAEVIAKDPLNDIAVLRIDASELPYLEFADSDQLRVGQTVIAIGNPLLEFRNSASVGVVSGLSRSVIASNSQGSSERLEGVIQTDAAINPGNSGGPLLNLNGDVIGVNVAVAAAENIGFSIPANFVNSVVDSVEKNGRIVRPYLGIRYMPVTESLVEANDLAVDYGVLIVRGEDDEDLAVIPGSPADKAGLLESDIILELNGEKLGSGTSLARLIAAKEVGETLKLKILHRGEEKEIEIVLEELAE